jgi:hypothetical protein
MKNKYKSETDSPLRVPKAKNKLGLKIHKIAMPHDDLIRAEKSHLELVENESMTSQTTMPSHTTQTSDTSQTRQTTQTRQSKEIAPSRDFQRTPNSLTREAIPDGLFKGKSKQLYDALYSLSRGAIVPSRSIRVRKSKLMKLANIGSRATFDSNINHLQTVGLITETIFTGEHDGNQFEIFLPEETVTLTSQSSQSSLTSSAQKQDTLVSLETSQTSQSGEPINIRVADVSKTSFKDNTKNDDEADALFCGFIEKFQAAAKKLTGAPLSKYEREKWGRLADLLILELETASRHASNPVSSVPAFLTKVLSSKLLNQKQPGPTLKSKPSAKPDTVGKHYPELDGNENEIKPLDGESKEAAITFLREFKDDKQFLDSYKQWYIEEDWNWIIKQLVINN